MLLNIRHGLLDISTYPCNKKSAIIINNEIVIASCTSLQPYFQPVSRNAKEESCIGIKVIQQLHNNALINVQEITNDETQLLKSLNFQVTFDQRKSVNRKSKIFSRYRAKLLYLFNCKKASKNLNQIIGENEDQMEHGFLASQVLLSSFLILSISQKKTSEVLNRFVTDMKNYIKFIYPIQTLDDVLVMCSPFGLENFYKTISIGKISNVIDNSCLFVLSNPLPIGCEGSAVFNNKLRLIGIVICTSFQRQNENVNLTLAVNFSHLIKDFMEKMGIKTTSTVVRKPLSNFKWKESMVIIEVNGSKGTGTFVKIRNKKFILTCSHVVFNSQNNICCRYVDGKFDSNVIWKNPTYDQPFDVAMLTCPMEIPNYYFVKLSTIKPTIGQTIFNAGFPFQLDYDFSPSIFQGRVIKCFPGAIISDGCLQAGQSGGPMFDENGFILGICVSNIKIDNTVYPNINTAIPINDIQSILELYAKTNDESILNKLIAKDDIKLYWSVENTSVLSKL